MKKIYLPLLALAAGFVNAFITTGVHSLFFVLLPILAFALGYFSSWRWGILGGFLLFMSYTFSLTLIWAGAVFYSIPYLLAFFGGGFSLLLIGALSPMVRKGLRKAGSIAALVILAIVVGWCGYSALPSYGYYYQVIIESSKNLNNLELYLPVGTIAGKPVEKLYSQPLEIDHLWMAPDFTQAVVDTEHGQMLKLNINGLREKSAYFPPGESYPYMANLVFWHKSAPHQLIQLMPRYDVTPLNTVRIQRSFGPVITAQSLSTEKFNVPVKTLSSTPGLIRLTLWNRTDRSEAVNFTYSKSSSYTERINYDLQTGNEWVFMPVEGTILVEIRGLGD